VSAQPETILSPKAHVTLEIPRALPYQLVYRQERDWPLEIPDLEGVAFHYCASLRDWRPHSRLLRDAFGTPGG
jgi:hypothetical protein